MPEMIKIAMIVARGRNGVIGRDGDLPWRLSADLKNFKKVTLGKPIIMGRATWESFPRRPLPGRENIVLSRDWNYAAPGGRVYSSLAPAISAAKAIAAQGGQNEVFIIGGGAIYEAALPMADRLYLTEVDAAPEGQVFFPALNMANWEEVSRTEHVADEKNDHAFAMCQLERMAG
jgi:dihydrofolate reductase